jgi:hypothetical protein
MNENHTHRVVGRFPAASERTRRWEGTMTTIRSVGFSPKCFLDPRYFSRTPKGAAPAHFPGHPAVVATAAVLYWLWVFVAEPMIHYHSLSFACGARQYSACQQLQLY